MGLGFSSECCTDSTTQAVDVVHNPSTDEASTFHMPYDIPTSRDENPDTARGQTMAVKVTPSAPEQDLEEQEKVKARLRRLTTEFVKEAVARDDSAGRCAVVVVDESVQSRYDAVYALDKKLTEFILTPIDASQSQRVIPIPGFRDTWLATEYRSCEVPAWRTKFDPDDLERLVVVEFQSNDLPPLFMLERTKEHAVRFVQAMTILTLYNSEAEAPKS
mmetsp:Transcript_58893/g.157421  ORF Transcript_58893/g.157421 Transcript_58893/m.157421 type:complete len:218 (+) Transcript_58893:840-1493(+)